MWKWRQNRWGSLSFVRESVRTRTPGPVSMAQRLSSPKALPLAVGGRWGRNSSGKGLRCPLPVFSRKETPAKVQGDSVSGPHQDA